MIHRRLKLKIVTKDHNSGCVILRLSALQLPEKKKMVLLSSVTRYHSVFCTAFIDCYEDLVKGPIPYSN